MADTWYIYQCDLVRDELIEQDLDEANGYRFAVYRAALYSIEMPHSIFSVRDPDKRETAVAFLNGRAIYGYDSPTG